MTNTLFKAYTVLQCTVALVAHIFRPGLGLGLGPGLAQATMVQTATSWTR